MGVLKIQGSQKNDIINIIYLKKTRSEEINWFKNSFMLSNHIIY